MTVKFKKLYPHVNLPGYAKSGDAGMDIESNTVGVVKYGVVTIFSTGLAAEVPEGYEIQVRPRSGLAAKYGITVVNSPGTIDAGFRGEIKVILTLLDEAVGKFHVNIGDRIAQLVVARVEQPCVEEVGQLSVSQRGEDGLGSTGLS